MRNDPDSLPVYAGCRGDAAECLKIALKREKGIRACRRNVPRNERERSGGHAPDGVWQICNSPEKIRTSQISALAIANSTGNLGCARFATGRDETETSIGRNR